MRKVLIIGRIPLPIGGVTVHVSRLLENLKKRHYTYFEFCDLTKNAWLEIFFKLLKFNVLHIHFSNPYYQLFIAVFARLARKKLIITYHGNWGRYKFLGNRAVNISAKLCDVPIVQNQESFRLAKRWNANVRLISTFIASNQLIPLDKLIAHSLDEFCKHHQHILCTNAWNVVLDKNGDEIYGISEIVRSIAKDKQCGLIVSDPSSKYFLFVKKLLGYIPENVHFVSEPHDFRNILDLSAAFIRNTSTDGVSLSIYEALERNVVVLASDCVARPEFCKVVKDFSKIDWRHELESGRINLNSKRKEDFLPDAVTELISVYEKCLTE
jgi:glycosyltransferase involved in cell wall biosynthesis